MKKAFCWSTEERDMAIAQSIMDQHREIPENTALAMFEVSMTPSRTIDKKGINLSFRMSPWLGELLKTYHDIYGYEHGMAIFLQVSVRIFMNEQTIH